MGQMTSRPYDRVLAILNGSQALLVEVAEAPQSTVSYWAECGFIPPRRQTTILRNAQRKGYALKPEHFVPNAAESAA